jgi:hypothetical protein
MKSTNQKRTLGVLALKPALAAATLALLVATLPAAAAGRNPNPGVLPPGSKPYGHTYGEWGALWWRWVLSIPGEQNPNTDDTGEDAANGQSGPVWFLGGTFGGTATRTVTVPAGKALFFPIGNGAWITTCNGEPRTKDGIRPIIAPAIDAGTYSAEIDGVPVNGLVNGQSQYRAETPLFCSRLDLLGILTLEDLAATCPPGESNPNCTDLPNPDEHFGPEDGFGPCMADGVWLMLAPLKRGAHTIHFAHTSGEFSVEVTYHLTVE